MNLTLEDYRRVLRWCGWTDYKTAADTAAEIMKMERKAHYWQEPNDGDYLIGESRLMRGERKDLLMLDYSVLEKVRADESLAAKLADHLAALVMPTSYAEDALLSYVLRGEPGCVTRAAINTGLVE